jgi:hypothetical protein
MLVPEGTLRPGMLMVEMPAEGQGQEGLLIPVRPRFWTVVEVG